MRRLIVVATLCLCSIAAAKADTVFPNAVSEKYAAEKPGMARLHTCLDQYMTNKTTNPSANGGLNWRQKGPGYYAECLKHLEAISPMPPEKKKARKRGH